MHMELVFKQQNIENIAEIWHFYCICFLIVKIDVPFLFLKENMAMFCYLILLISLTLK